MWKEDIEPGVEYGGRIRVFHLVKNSIGNNSIGWLVGRLLENYNSCHTCHSRELENKHES